MRSHRSRQHVGSINVTAIISSQPRLALAVGVDQEAAKVRNDLIDFIGFLFPPGGDFRAKRISRLQAAQLDGSREARGEKNSNAVRTKDVGNGGGLAQVVSRQKDRICVDVIDG